MKMFKNFQLMSYLVYEETSKSLDISISKIATTIKLAMGIVTIGDIFQLA